MSDCERERDEAQATLKAIREAIPDPTDMTIVDTRRLLAILDSAPPTTEEPEWEWAVRVRFATVSAWSEAHAHGMLNDVRYQTGAVVRRRKAGPWLPVVSSVEGEAEN